MKKLTFIGAGSIAEALLSGIIENQLLQAENIWVTNRNNEQKLHQLKNKYGVNYSYNQEELFKETDAVILAMKPKDAAQAITELKQYFSDGMLVISVLAGISIKTIENLIGKKLAVVRAMPNTSAAVGKSATALAANDKVSLEQMGAAHQLFNTVGYTTFVKEDQLDAVTGLSGSGPAYIYYLVEAMEQSAVEIGLEKQMAKELIVQTLLGAAEMLTKSEKEPGQLRREVTSPGGTTEAGIGVLEAHGVQKAFISCIKEATVQSKRLGNMLSEEISAVSRR